MPSVPQFNRVTAYIARIVAAVGLGGCAGGGGALGPCVITYEEPLFSIATARDAQSDAPIAQIVLREFTYDRPPGSRPPMLFLTNHVGLTPTNVTRTATELLCTVRCTFGAGEGGYTFTFGAEGYRDAVVTVVDAKFTRGTGSCPRTVSGGVTLDLRLTRQ